MLNHYTDIIYYDHSTITDDIVTFLESMDIEMNWFYGWGPHHNQTLLDQPVDGGQHQTSSKIQSTDDLKLIADFYRIYYYNKQYAKHVMSLFERDYTFFNMSRPKWIDFFA